MQNLSRYVRNVPLPWNPPRGPLPSILGDKSGIHKSMSRHGFMGLGLNLGACRRGKLVLITSKLNDLHLAPQKESIWSAYMHVSDGENTSVDKQNKNLLPLIHTHGKYSEL